jgi:hypothetical protein
MPNKALSANSRRPTRFHRDMKFDDRRWERRRPDFDESKALRWLGVRTKGHNMF